jgi:hypothetical protein
VHPFVRLWSTLLYFLALDGIPSLPSVIAGFPSLEDMRNFFVFYHKTPWQISKTVVYCRHKEQGSDSSEELEHDSSARDSVGRYEGLMYSILHGLFSIWSKARFKTIRVSGWK